MSNATPPPAPGFEKQAAARTSFRVFGLLLVGTGLALMVIGGFDFFGTVDSLEGPTKFWMFFIGIPLLGVGGWFLQAGFAGVGARYLAGEQSPVAKDTAEYLTEGKGMGNLGVSSATTLQGGVAGGPYCRSCGTRNDADARFCDSCGTTMA